MIDKALKEIRRGSVEIIDFEHIKKLLERYFQTGERYNVKAGFDPTAPDLHLGHTVLLQKLSIFQQYGANVQFLIGDFTAQIGDPTGKNATRKVLSKEQVLQNAKSYKDQIFNILDPDKTIVVFNSAWLDALGSKGLLELTMTYNVARMLERESKSLNNYIGVTEKANDMFGKILSISDELMWRYYELLSSKFG